MCEFVDLVLCGISQHASRFRGGRWEPVPKRIRKWLDPRLERMAEKLSVAVAGERVRLGHVQGCRSGGSSMFLPHSHLPNLVLDQPEYLGNQILRCHTSQSSKLPASVGECILADMRIIAQPQSVLARAWRILTWDTGDANNPAASTTNYKNSDPRRRDKRQIQLILFY